MRRSRFAFLGAVVGVVTLAATCMLLFAGSASAAPVFGIGVFKDCGFVPINVGDPVNCEFELDNTTQTSHNTVTWSNLDDTIPFPGGTTFHHPINMNFPGLILTGGATCDATKCTLPFGATISTPYFSDYTAQVSDFPTLTDQGSFTWGSNCDVLKTGCNAGPNTATQTAQTEINPLQTKVDTVVHDANHNPVTAIEVGGTIHDHV